MCEDGIGGQYVICDLFTVVLVSGVTLRWASWGTSITFPATGIYDPGTGVGGNVRVSGQTYSAAGPFVTRTAIKQSLKLQTCEAKITVLATPEMFMPGTTTPVYSAIAQGQFGGAMVYIDRLWMQTAFPLDFTLGTIVWFVGRVGPTKLNRDKAIMTVRDPTILFGDPHPRNLILTGCRHSFGDAGCTYPIDSVGRGGGAPAQATGSIVSISSPTLSSVTLTTTLTQPGPLPPPTSVPSYSLLTNQNEINLPSATYYVVITFIGAAGESLPGPELSVPVTGGGQNGTTATLLRVNAPSSPPSGATGWNVYVGLASGEEEFQQSFTGFGGQWTQTQTLAQGASPPVQGTQGYFAGGMIQFTSGVLSGLSASVTSYAAGGIVVVTPPLMVAPADGDTFLITAGCDRTIAICTYRWANETFYAGMPFLPASEISI